MRISDWSSDVCSSDLIVGIGMRSHVGVASLMFRTLSEEGINIQMISTSEIKTSVIINDKYMELAVRALHKAFGLDQDQSQRSEERRVGKECVSTCRSRWSPSHEQKKKRNKI